MSSYSEEVVRVCIHWQRRHCCQQASVEKIFPWGVLFCCYFYQLYTLNYHICLHTGSSVVIRGETQLAACPLLLLMFVFNVSPFKCFSCTCSTCFLLSFFINFCASSVYVCLYLLGYFYDLFNLLFLSRMVSWGKNSNHLIGMS